MYCIIIVVCFLLNTLPELVNCAETDFYTAGVVEFSKLTSVINGFDTRLDAFLTIINSTEAKSTDILVFPESALNENTRLTFVPSEKDNIIPCLHKNNGLEEEYELFLIKLSCAARTAQKYLVINIKEKEICSDAALINKDMRPCADNDLNIYNTNVVFDRTGRIVSRYRKFNIYVEASNQTLVTDYGIFDTDFGVRFGHFICFDINFYEPAEELVKRFGIKNFILPLHFASELPFLTAVQLEQAWAWGNNVNLLAAGGSYPFTGATGSGIFSGKAGALEAIMTGDFGVRKLLVAKVPKIPGEIKPTQSRVKRAPQTKVTLLRDPEMENFESQLLDFSVETKISSQLCSNGLCCSFNITLESQAQNTDSIWYQYRIGVFNGRRTYKKRVFSDLSVCAIYACTNSSASSCGNILQQENISLRANFIFKSILIEGDFENRDRMLLMPNSVDVALYPLPADFAEWSVKDLGKTQRVSWKLTSAVNDLLTFGVYGNYYLKSTAALKMISSVYVLAMIIILNFIGRIY